VKGPFRTCAYSSRRPTSATAQLTQCPQDDAGPIRQLYEHGRTARIHICSRGTVATRSA
jgi:hypothetical protein